MKIMVGIAKNHPKDHKNYRRHYKNCSTVMCPELVKVNVNIKKNHNLCLMLLCKVFTRKYSHNTASFDWRAPP